MTITEREQAEVDAWRQLGYNSQRLIQRRVDRGERLLDVKLGNVWPFHMNLDRFDLSTACSCVLGQLAVDIVPKRKWLSGRYRRFTPGYSHALQALSMSERKAQTHGFQADSGCGITCDALAYCWRRRLKQRGAR